MMLRPAIRLLVIGDKILLTDDLVESVTCVGELVSSASGRALTVIRVTGYLYQRQGQCDPNKAASTCLAVEV